MWEYNERNRVKTQYIWVFYCSIFVVGFCFYHLWIRALTSITGKGSQVVPENMCIKYTNHWRLQLRHPHNSNQKLFKHVPKSLILKQQVFAFLGQNQIKKLLPTLIWAQAVPPENMLQSTWKYINNKFTFLSNASYEVSFIRSKTLLWFYWNLSECPKSLHVRICIVLQKGK